MQKKIQILYVLDKLSFSSGVSSVVMNYLRHMNKEEFQFDIVVHKQCDEALLEEACQLGCAVYQLPDITLKGWRDYKKAFANVLKSRPYIIVHGHIANAAFLYMREAKKQKIPIRIMHAHNAMGADQFYKRVRNKILEKGIRHWSNYFFACSDAAAAYLYGLKFSDITILPNAIDIEKYTFNQYIREEMRKELGIGEDCICIGHIGRFAPQKNHRFLVEAFQVFHKMHANSKLILVGDGPLEEEVRNKVDKLNLSSAVLFLGKRQDADRLYQVFDVFWLPSIFEGLPVSGVEAQCAGLTCIIADTITKELSITNNIHFVSLLSPAKWAVQTSIDLHQTRRREQRPQVKDAGFDIKVQANKLLKVYNDILTLLQMQSTSESECFELNEAPET